jgi:subtilisin family serine protease
VKSRRWLHPLFTVALCLCAFSLAAKPIKLRNQTIETSREGTGQKAEADGAASLPQQGLFLIQLSAPADAESRGQLISLGVELLHYVPEDAFVARLRNVPPGQVRRLPFVQWMGRYRPEHKVHQRLAQAGDSPEVSVLIGRGANAAEIAGVKAGFAKLQQESRSRLGTILRGRLAPGQLQKLAQSDSVLWIEPAPKMKLFDEISSDIVGGFGGRGTSQVHDLGYTGNGVTVSVADSGLHTGNAPGMHPDLAGRVTAFFYYGELSDASDEHSHGTHCAGIVAGNGAIGEADEDGNVYGLGWASPPARISLRNAFSTASAVIRLLAASRN